VHAVPTYARARLASFPTPRKQFSTERALINAARDSRKTHFIPEGEKTQTMTTKLALLFSLCLAIGALMLACGGGGNTTNSGTTASGDKVGVAECDEYIQKVEACLTSKVPENMRGTYKSSLDTMRTTWKKAAETPQGKAALAQGCKTALEQAKTTMGSYGCSW
jgi:hypothetical protein